MSVVRGCLLTTPYGLLTRICQPDLPGDTRTNRKLTAVGPQATATLSVPTRGGRWLSPNLAPGSDSRSRTDSAHARRSLAGHLLPAAPLASRRLAPSPGRRYHRPAAL